MVISTTKGDQETNCKRNNEAEESEEKEQQWKRERIKKSLMAFDTMLEFIGRMELKEYSKLV